MLELPNFPTPMQAKPAAHAVRGVRDRAGESGVDDWTHFDRFLAGCDGTTYRVDDRTPALPPTARRCLTADGLRFVSRIVATSESGRVPKNDPVIFSLALAAKLGDEPTRSAAYAALPRVCRVATDVMRFADHAQAFGGWGRGMRKAVAAWFNARSASDLALQLACHHTADRWSVRDLLRLAHPRAASIAHDRLFSWAVRGVLPDGAADDPVFAPIVALRRLATCDPYDDDQLAAAAAAIRDHRIPHDRVPAHLLRFPAVWDALLDHLSGQALLACLAPMTRAGFVAASRCHDGATARTIARIHQLAGEVDPFALAVALVSYRTGRGRRSSWLPVLDIIDALEDAFYASLDRIAAGRAMSPRTLVCVDVSSSMATGSVGGIAGVTPQLAAAAQAMVAVAEGGSVAAFAGSLSRFAIGADDRLDDVVASTTAMPSGRVDCALPMRWAQREQIDVDLFVVYTDDETRPGDVPPVRALRAYREARGVPAKLIVVGMMSNGFRIADPDDAGMLDVVGFDASTAPVLSDFARARMDVDETDV